MRDYKGEPSLAKLLLGDGITTICFPNGPSFDIDLDGWVKWYIENGEKWAPEKGPKAEWALIDAIQEKAKTENGVVLNVTQSRALLNGIMDDYKKKLEQRDDSQTLPPSMESTPST